MGVPGMTKEWKGETVYMPEAFGIKSGKSLYFGRIKQKKSGNYALLRKMAAQNVSNLANELIEP